MHNSKNTTRRIFIKILCFSVVFLLLQSVLAFVAVPARSYSRLMLHELYSSSEPIDIGFLGASRFFRGVNTKEIDEQLGINSFDLGSSNQSLADAYYLLRETYRYRPVKLLVLDLSANRLYADASNFSAAIVLDYMKFSKNKAAYFFGAVDYEDYFKTLLPGLHYNNELLSTTWLSNAPIKLSRAYREYSPEVARYPETWYSGKGYISVSTAYKDRNIGKVNVAKWEPERVSKESLAYVEKIIGLCRTNGTDVICMSVPTPMASFGSMGNYQEYFDYIKIFLEQYDVPYYNFTLVKPSVFLCKETNFTDPMHLNVEGALSFTNKLAGFFREYQAGTLNPEDYFYDSCDEMLRDGAYVYSVWMEPQRNQNELTAYSYYGTTVTPEYAFYYKKAGMDDFVLYRDYNENHNAEVSLLDPGEYIIRAETRAVGSSVDYDQYDEITYTVK